MIRILFRTCEKVNSIHGLPRPFGLSKLETIKICFKSIVASCKAGNLNPEIWVVGDKLSKELVDWFNEFNPHKIINEDFGNDASLRYCFDLTKLFDGEDIVYFVEDDYLHLMKSIPACVEILTKTPIFIHPTDYPNFYHPKHIIQTNVFCSNLSHWRLAPSTTFTFITKVKKIREHWDFMYSCCTGADDVKISTLFGWDIAKMEATENRKEEIYAPIPSLAAHMHVGTLPMTIDWKKVAEAFK